MPKTKISKAAKDFNVSIATVVEFLQKKGISIDNNPNTKIDESAYDLLVMEYAPDLKVCVGWDGNKDPMSIVDRAIALGAYKVQLFKPYFNQASIDKAHANGILCNVFWADDPDEARRYFRMGVDTVLTNDYLTVFNAVNGCYAEENKY